MRTLCIFILTCLLQQFTILYADNPKFYIQLTSNNDEAKSYMPYFESKVIAELKNNFECAVINTSSKIEEFVSLEREKQILGKANEWDSESYNQLSDRQKAIMEAGENISLEDIGKLLNHEYLIGLEIKLLGENLLLSAFCLHSKMKQLTNMSRASSVVTKGEAAYEAIDKVSFQLIEGLKEYEICPFTGRVDIKISSLIDTLEIEEYSVYCNNEDKAYRKSTKNYSRTESTWNLQRKGISWTDGDMNFSHFESTGVDEMNGCYRCSSGREGGRSFRLYRSFEVSGSGISHQSIRNGNAQDDTRVELEFRDDNTYYIRIKGTSMPAVADEKVDISAEGTCDNLSQQKKLIRKEFTVPLNLLFGPYNGNSAEKVLLKHEEINIVDPVGGEKTKIILDFELRSN